MRHPDTDFCGYSVPHPSEPLMNVRLQTRGDVPAKTVLDEGLRQLGAICDSLTAQLDKEEGLAATRKRSDSAATFPGPAGPLSRRKGVPKETTDG